MILAGNDSDEILLFLQTLSLILYIPKVSKYIEKGRSSDLFCPCGLPTH